MGTVRRLIGLALVLAVLALATASLPDLASPALAATLTVNTLTDDAVNGNGLCSLREAIINANADNQSGSTDCAAGSGVDTISFSVSGPIALASALPAITDADLLTINGGGAIMVSGANFFRVFEVSAGAALSLQALVVSNGSAANGGGILNFGTLTLNGSTVSGNSGNDGGGIFNNAGTITLTGSTVSGNSALALGGGIFNQGTMTLTSSTISGNTASSGGGVSNFFGTMTLTSSSVSGNTATSQGGGIYNFAGGTMTLTNSTVTGNSAPTGGVGGGIFNQGTMTLASSTVSGNSASLTGGGIFNAGGGMLTLTDSTISGNSAAVEGGGIFNNGTLTVIRSTVSGNTASGGAGGGGIRNNLGTSNLTNSTVSGNTALFGGGGVSSGGGGISNSGTVTLTNVTLTGNSGTGSTGDGGGAIRNVNGTVNLFSTILTGNIGNNCAGPMNSGGYNLASDTTCSLGAAELSNNPNANLGPLTNNGGPTLTHALQTGSAAIDAGNPACPLPATDQRGVPRPQEGDGNAATTARCDIGAYEFGDLSITKADSPDPVVAGSNLTYTLTVTNARAVAASNVTLSDALPAGTTFVSFTAPAGWAASTPAVGGTGTVTVTNPSLAAAATATFTLVVNVNSNAPASLSNTATVASTPPDTITIDNSATASTAVQAADLSVTKVDSPDPVVAGNNLTYTVTVTNTGAAAATNVTLSENLPISTPFVSLPAPAGWNCTTPAVGDFGPISCSIGSLAPGATATFSLVVHVNANLDQGFVLTNTATVASSPVDANPGNNSSSTTTTVNSQADMTVTKTDSPDPVMPNADLTYTITVTNNGPSHVLTGLTLTDSVPAGTTFVSFTAPAVWTSTTPAVGGTGPVSSTRPTFTAGSSAVFTLVVHVNAGASGSLTNTATVASSTTDPNPANNSATTTTAVSMAPTVTATATATATVTATATATATRTPVVLVQQRPPQLGAFYPGGGVTGSDSNLARATAQAGAGVAASQGGDTGQAASAAAGNIRPPSTGDGGRRDAADGGWHWAPVLVLLLGSGVVTSILMRRRA